MIDPFYRAFEEKHRGSRGLITERLHVYLPFIRPLLKIYGGGQAVDLGCGRGEWLELLTKEGFSPTGVDLDEGMLSACQQLGLPAVKADALDLLSETESNSQLVVSAFHVVEHISFEQLKTLVTQALRVLKPGGLLILETPNPENIAVAIFRNYCSTRDTPFTAPTAAPAPSTSGASKSYASLAPAVFCSTTKARCAAASL